MSDIILNSLEVDGVTAKLSASGTLTGLSDALVDPTLSISGMAADAEVTGDNFAELHAHLDDVVTMLYADGESVSIQRNTDETLAVNSPTGHVHVKSTSQPIYTGTPNFIDLIGLAQGTFTDSVSGITIEISGNEIYIHGDVANGFRFNPQTGEFFSDSFSNHPADYSNLPNDDCFYNVCWWEKSGYSLPSNVYLAVKGTDGNTKAIALSEHSNNFKRSMANQFLVIYAYQSITGINAKFTIGLKLNNLTGNQGYGTETVAKLSYDTKIINSAGYYDLSDFTWTGVNTTYDVVSTVPYLEHDPLTKDKVYAWFGDSLSQLRELPNLVSSLLNVKVYDFSFAGAPLTYGDPVKYQPQGFMSLCDQIIAEDFTPLAGALDALENDGKNVTEQRQHLAVLQTLDFNEVTDVVVFAGTNDFDNDYVNATNFVNGFSDAVTTLLTAYPHIIINVISPKWRGDKTEGVVTIPTMEDLIQLEKNVADSFCLPFYDLYHRSGINALTASVYLESDLLHLSADGDELLANKCAKFLQSN